MIKNPVPKIRFKEFTEDYKEIALTEIAEVIGGGTPDTKKNEYWNGTIDWYTPTEIGNKKYVSSSMRKISDLGLKNSSAKLLPVGTILLSSRATIGDSSILMKEACTNQGFQSLVAKDNVYNEYLYYLINKLKNKFLKFATGSTFSEISKSNIENIITYTPFLREQEKIANFLSIIDKKIEYQQLKIELLQKYKAGIKEKLFLQLIRFKDNNGNDYPKWTKKKLKSITDIYDGTHQTPNYTSNGIKFLSVENINNIDQSEKYISEADFNKEFKIFPEKGDILMTRIGDVGTSTLLENNDKYAFYVSLALLKTSRSNLISSSFLNQYISSNYFQRELYKRILHVAFPKKINKGDIGECHIFIPTSIEEQKKISDFLTKIDKKIKNEDEIKNKWHQIKKFLMQQMFV